MLGVPFLDQNIIFRRPPGMTEEQCYDLHCKRTTNGDSPAIEAVFEITDEELAIIVKSKKIRLGVLGNGLPPVYLLPEPEFTGVCGVSLEWKIYYDPSDLSNIMKAEDCRHVGTFDECTKFVKENKPKDEPTDAKEGE